jgi:hypothetical protein
MNPPITAARPGVPPRVLRSSIASFLPRCSFSNFSSVLEILVSRMGSLPFLPVPSSTSSFALQVPGAVVGVVAAETLAGRVVGVVALLSIVAVTSSNRASITSMNARARGSAVRGSLSISARIELRSASLSSSQFPTRSWPAGPPQAASSSGSTNTRRR